MFGGWEGFRNNNFLQDTWEYYCPTMGAAQSFGTACTGTSGTPTIGADGGRRPWVGDLFAVRLGNLPATSPGAAVILGFSRTAWGALPLPLELAFLGMPGCRLYASVDLSVLVPNAAPVLQIAIPNDAALAGLEFFTQGLVFDAGANAFGATTTTGLAAVIGLR